MDLSLQNTRVGTRLGYAFGFLLAVMAGLGYISLHNLSAMQQRLDQVVQVNGAKTQALATMLDTTQQVATLMRDAALRRNAGIAREAQQQLAAMRAQFDAANARLQVMPASASGRVLRERALEARAHAKPINDRVLALLAAGAFDQADALLTSNATPAMQAWQDPLRANMALQFRNNAEAYADAQDGYRKARAMVLGIVGAALLLTLVLAWRITRSLTAPLADATRVARDVAAGRLEGNIRVRGRDEVADLLASMREMQATLQRFAGAQDEIGRQHDAGQIGYRIPAGDFSGAYARMAEGINTLAASHIAVKMRVIDVVSAYARGDLSQDIDRYPGEKARITDAVDAVKAGMLAFNEELQALVGAAVAGDFSHRGDAAGFAYSYRELVERLNALMATADGGIAEIGELLSAMAEGDLNRRVDATLPGDFGRLADNANQMAERLTQIVAQIRVGSDAINAAAGEISAGNNDLSQRTEQQAASLEETASSMEELTSTVKQNADNARQANQLARGAADVAEQGGAVVGQVVHTMSAISDSSKKIADIIGVIDGIAFQTNILALNAAVEAARAGEQGRGFAVVASEVRSLAQRSANAAKEIKQLITDSVGKVEEGSQLVDRAGKTMGEIVTSVKRVTDIIADIAAASAEQSAGIEQVNVAITSMDEGTQQNAALVEEASASARSLEQQAEQLVQTVAVFRVDPARMAQLERPHAEVVELAAPRARKAAAVAAAKPAARRPRAQVAVASADNRQWEEF